MNTSNYSEKLPQSNFNYASPNYQMRSSGYSFNGSIASNSNGFYPTAVSTPAYDRNNPNVKITSKADEMLRRTEEISRRQKFDLSTDKDLIKIKRKLDLSDGRLALLGKVNVSNSHSNYMV